MVGKVPRSGVCWEASPPQHSQDAPAPSTGPLQHPSTPSILPSTHCLLLSLFLKPLFSSVATATGSGRTLFKVESEGDTGNGSGDNSSCWPPVPLPLLQLLPAVRCPPPPSNAPQPVHPTPVSPVGRQHDQPDLYGLRPAHHALQSPAKLGQGPRAALLHRPRHPCVTPV